MSTTPDVKQTDAPADMIRAHTIAQIVVKRLLGKFNYTLDLLPGVHTANGLREPSIPRLFSASEERLTLLYGNNGSGKTTLLRLLFHALSAANDRGHRTAIGNTRFEAITIVLADGATVAYRRDDGRLDGPFKASFQSGPDAEPVLWEWQPHSRTISSGVTTVATEEYLRTLQLFDPQYLRTSAAFKVAFGEKSGEERFIEALAERGINPVFLTDARIVTADALERDDRTRHGREIRWHSGQSSDVDQEVGRQRELDVDEALSRSRAVLSQLVLAGAQSGTQRVDNVYLNVAGVIVTHSSPVQEPSRSILPELRTRIADLTNEAEPFTHYGLLPEFPGNNLLGLLEKANQATGPLLQHVLTPYLEGWEQRMEAMKPGLRAVASFVDSINTFLEGKAIHFSPSPSGIRIVDDETQESLSAGSLSSGEKQIILLFSDLVALQGQTRLFLIDEPELSLNAEWQRKLMPTLLNMTEETQTQVIIATHSLEIMARYRQRIESLRNES